MIARIYSPAKSAMQSGKAKSRHWVLQYELEAARMIDPLMGYISSTDMNGQVTVQFATQEEAEAFADKYGIAYKVMADHKATRQKLSYADNFRVDRLQPWTH